MYQSHIALSTKSKDVLSKKLHEFLLSHEKTYCKALKRTVSLGKLPEVILKRKESSTARLRCFFVALDVLKEPLQNPPLKSHQ